MASGADTGGNPRTEKRVEIREVVGRRDQRAFVRLPWRLYAGDSCWVPPLVSGIKRTLDPKRNPFFKHAEMHLYLAWRGGRPVGRIAATVDHLYNEHRGDATGFWGFFEAENDAAVARALFDRAAEDLRDRGMTEMQGPMNPSANGQCGLLVEGFDHPPAVAMPYNPAYYSTLVEQSGLRSVEELYGYDIDAGHLRPGLKTMQRLERLARATAKRHPDLTVRRIDMKRFRTDALNMGRLFDAALNDLPGHVPIPEAEMVDTARDLKFVVDPALVLIAEVAGETVGCAYGVPDINPIVKQINGRLFPFGWLRLLRGRRTVRRARLIGYAALPAYRTMGVVPLLMFRLICSVQERGYTSAELSFITDINTRSFRTLEHAVAPRLYKRYRIYSAQL